MGDVTRPINEISGSHPVVLDVFDVAVQSAVPIEILGRFYVAACRNNPVSRLPGIAGCCARAASGQAVTAPPSVRMNSRRRMWVAMRPSRGVMPMQRMGRYHALIARSVT